MTSDPENQDDYQHLWRKFERRERLSEDERQFMLEGAAFVAYFLDCLSHTKFRETIGAMLQVQTRLQKQRVPMVPRTRQTNGVNGAHAAVAAVGGKPHVDLDKEKFTALLGELNEDDQLLLERLREQIDEAASGASDDNVDNVDIDGLEGLFDSYN